MSPHRVRAITVRILSQFRHDRRTLALLFVAPLVILTLLSFLLRGGGSKPAVGVVNLDARPLGSTIAAHLQSSSLVSATAMDRAAAEKQLHDGSLTGYVLFPADFTDRALNQHELRPEIHLEGSQPGPSQQTLQAVSQATLAAISALPIPIQGGPPRFSPLVSYLYGGPNLDTLDYLGAALIGLVVFFLVFVVTSVSFLRERTQGTLERLMATPLRRAEIVLGYMLGFTVLALIQSAEVLLFSLYVLKLYNAGSVWLIFLVAILMAIAAVNLGIFVSMFARTEFQAVQFIPLVIVPQFLLSGILVPVSTEPGWMQPISKVLPLTYAVDGLRSVMIRGADLSWSSLQLDTGVVFGFCVLMVVLASLTLRRRVA
jgi:ABC-2 type transport system permease protein